MFVIKNVETGKFAKHTGTSSSYPWKMVSNIEDATAYRTFAHANEVAFWHLDHTEKWLIVNKITGKEYDKEMGRYLPV